MFYIYSTSQFGSDTQGSDLILDPISTILKGQDCQLLRVHQFIALFLTDPEWTKGPGKVLLMKGLHKMYETLL